MANDNLPRKPLARASEKYHAHTVKMPDSLWQRFTNAAISEGESNISTFVRSCAVIGLEYRERDQAFGAYRRMTGITARAGGNPRGITNG